MTAARIALLCAIALAISGCVSLRGSPADVGAWMPVPAGQLVTSHIMACAGGEARVETFTNGVTITVIGTDRPWISLLTNDGAVVRMYADTDVDGRIDRTWASHDFNALFSEIMYSCQPMDVDA